MDKDYREIKEDYLRISSQTRNKLTALCVVFIGAIYFFYNPHNIFWFRYSLIFLVMTILGEIIAGLCASQHYSLWFSKKIKTVDYTESLWGRFAEVFFWIPPITFVIASTLFFIGLFK